MAACTSRAAASMFRFRSNCSATPVLPNWLEEVIWLIAAMRPNCRSSGVATADAIVCGSAPGNEAPTLITGKFIFGNEATGKKIECQDSRQQQRHRQQRSANWATDKWSRDTHRLSGMPSCGMGLPIWWGANLSPAGHTRGTPSESYTSVNNWLSSNPPTIAENGQKVVGFGWQLSDCNDPFAPPPLIYRFTIRCHHFNIIKPCTRMMV